MKGNQPKQPQRWKIGLTGALVWFQLILKLLWQISMHFRRFLLFLLSFLTDSDRKDLKSPKSPRPDRRPLVISIDFKAFVTDFNAFSTLLWRILLGRFYKEFSGERRLLRLWIFFNRFLAFSTLLWRTHLWRFYKEFSCERRLLRFLFFFDRFL